MQANDKGERMTGTKDAHFDLVSILYHGLKSASAMENYLRDAQQDGDDELSQFIQNTAQEDKRRAEKAKILLAQRLGQPGINRSSSERVSQIIGSVDSQNYPL